MKKLLLFVVGLIFSLGMFAQPSTGDVCIIGMNSDDPDMVLLVTLVDIAPGTVLYVTDNEWDGANSTWVTGEGFKSFTVGNDGLSAGDVVQLDLANNSVSPSTAGTIASVSGSLLLSTGGDQVYVFLDTDGDMTTTNDVTFLFAINTTGAWGTDELTGTGLTDGTDALTFASSTDDIRYIGPRAGQNTFADYKSLIADVTNNWEISGTAFTFDLTNFTLATTPTKLAITQVTPNPQYANWEFEVTVQAQDDNGTPGNVSQATTFNLTTDGTGTITIVNGTAEIPAGQNSVTLTVRYDVAETFNLGATVTAGDALADATPVSMTIEPMPTHTISTTPDSLVFDKNPTATLHDHGIYVYTTVGSPWAVSSYSGDYFMKATNYNGASYPTDTWAILPRFTGANNAIANFVSASYADPTGMQTTFSVKVSTDYQGYGDPANATWTDLTFNQPTGNWTWVKSGDIDLSAYNGQDFYLAFVLTSDGSDNNTIEVDSMVIYNQSTTTAINELTNNDLSIYPNPVSNVLYVNATGNLDIVDNTGRVVKHVIVKGAGTINVADLQPGIYFARLTGENKAVSVRKFIKR